MGPPELLAPAGGHDALVAAVNNGADAVYVGLREFNARRGAENLDLADLSEACRFTHLRGAKVYLTANVLVLPDEMRRALTMVDEAWAAGVDAVIVQDLGFLRVLREALPHVRVHASTQMNTHDPFQARTLATLGVSRVTLARECSLDEIASIVQASPVEIETFVHGALCFSYSGQCLLSSLIGGRSANRGLCAQPCRLPYDLVGETGPVRTDGRHLLSPRDLAGIGWLPGLIRAGVAALKIEGRMKAPEYVAVVTRVYRGALDRAYVDPEGFAVTDEEFSLLEEAFSRGFTDAYLAGRADDSMMSRSRPNNRGVAIGRVTSVEGTRATVAFDEPAEADDTVEFWTSKGRIAQRLGSLEVGGEERTSVPAGATARISVNGPVRPHDRVFRVASASLIAAARRTFAGAATDVRPTPIVLRARLDVGRPLELAAEAGDVRVRVEGPVLEPARTKAVAVDEVMEHLGRLGGTGYVVDAWDVRLEPGVGIGFGRLHEVRRRLVQALDEARLAPWSTRRLARPRLPRVRGREERGEAGDLALVVLVPDAGYAEPVLEAGADRVLVRVHPGVVPATDTSRVGLAVPRVLSGKDLERLGDEIPAGSVVAAGTLGALTHLAQRDVSVEADWSLNVTNLWTVDLLGSLGARLIWASPELTGGQLATLVAGSPLAIGVVVAGRTEVMVARHCLLQAIGPCAHMCPTCARRERSWRIVDRKGYGFPLIVDPTGRSHLFNAVPLDLVRVLPQLRSIGIAAIRIDITTEPLEEAVRLVAALAYARDAAVRGRAASQPEPLFPEATTGHYFRGVR